MRQTTVKTQTMTTQTNPKILVIDDHSAVLDGTVNSIRQKYPEAKISIAQTAQAALAEAKANPDLVVVDLCLPETVGETAKTEVGLQLIRELMQQYPTLHFTVQSAYTASLVRLKPAINSHEGGFTIVSKSLSLQEMLDRIDWALQGLVFIPKEMRSGLEMKSEWLQMLKFAFEEGLQDKAIAERMNVAERTVRHYWTRIQDVLGVYPDEGKNIRIQTEIRARQEGLID
jgi:DNA-binding NarL/FixJ family response regulator